MSLFQNLDEVSALDADFIQSADSPNKDISRLKLSTPSRAVDITQGDAIIRYRYRSSGPDADKMTVRLKEGTTVIAEWEHAAITTTYVTAAQTLTAGQKAAIGDWSNLYIEFEARPLSPPTYVARYLKWQGLTAGSSETVNDGTMVLPEAGRYLVLLSSDLEPDLTLSGSNVLTSIIRGTVKSGVVSYLRAFEVTCSAASTLVITNETGAPATSFFRTCSIFDLSDFIFMEFQSGSTTNGSQMTASFASALVDDLIAAAMHVRDGDHTAANWAGGIVDATDQVFEDDVGAQLSSGAMQIVASGGAFSVQVTPTGGTSGGATLAAVRFKRPDPIETFQSVFSDLFNSRSETLEAGANWSRLRDTGHGATATVGSDQVSLNGGGTNWQINAWETPQTLNANHYARAKYISRSGGGAPAFSGAGVGICMSNAGSFDGYVALHAPLGFNGGYPYLDLLRFDNSGNTRIGVASVILNSGDDIRIWRDATHVYVDLNDGSGWRTVITSADTTYTSGAVGLVTFAHAAQTQVWDDFDCGNVV